VADTGGNHSQEFRWPKIASENNSIFSIKWKTAKNKFTFAGNENLLKTTLLSTDTTENRSYFRWLDDVENNQ
jgi:hypothetical protein